MFIVTTYTQHEILSIEEFDTMEAAVDYAAGSMEDMATNPDADDPIAEDPLFLAAAKAITQGALSASVQAAGEPEIYTVAISKGELI
jgi:hypothetical protein